MSDVAANVQGAIETTIKDRLSPDRVVEVRVEKGEDHEGDPILSVLIVLRSEKGIRGSVLSGLVRHLRNRLSQENEFSFPIVRMMTEEDAGMALHGAG